MDPNTKIVLDEMQQRFVDEMKKQFDVLDSKWTQQFTDAENRKEERVLALEQSVEAAATAFETWRPQIDSAVEDLKMEVTKLNKHLDRALLDRSTDSGLLQPTVSATARPYAGFTADGSSGHRHEHNHRDHEFGIVFTHTHIPVKGTSPPLFTPPSSKLAVIPDDSLM
ncbi:hypothetical protein PAHAL_7G260200 [Panicum hallii]|jgi:hypothetical protein|uniref:Uncharacterized protein n=1 Tax=Panicum hallii TaxID=206008 RepID=A0A2S3I9P2_9POAL|nr:hypothetical protein PAHAL_7G260200 [Panicum hallii]